MKVCKNCHTSCLDERVHCTQCGGTNFYLSKEENAGKGSNKEKVLKRILFGVMGIAIIVILLSAGSIFICSRQAEKKNTENGDVVSPIVVNKASDGNDLEEYTAKKYTEFLEKMADKFEKAEAKYTVIKAQQDTEETEDSGNEQENDEGKKSSIVKEQPYNVREKNSAVENNTMYDSVEGTEMVYSTTLIGAKYSFYDDRQIAYAESVLLDGNQLTILGSMEMVSAEDFYNGEAAEYQEYQEYQEWNFELTDETVYNNGSELDPSMPEGKAFLTDEGILHSGLALYFSVQNGVVKEITLSP